MEASGWLSCVRIGAILKGVLRAVKDSIAKAGTQVQANVYIETRLTNHLKYGRGERVMFALAKSIEDDEKLEREMVAEWQKGLHEAVEGNDEEKSDCWQGSKQGLTTHKVLVIFSVLS